MPILIMALLALIIFGTIGILLAVAVIMEHSPAEHPARRHGPHPVSSDVVPSSSLNFDKPRAEGAATEESVREHVTVG